MSKENIRKFDPNIFNSIQNFSMGITAARNSGKTTLLKYLCNVYFVDRFDEILLFSTTALSADIYEGFPGIKLTNFDNDVVTALILLQQENSERKVLVILDDCVGSKVKYSEGLLKLFCLGRNLNISVIYSVQSATLLTTDMKENLTFLVIMNTNSTTKKRHLVETFLEGNLDLVGDDAQTKKEEFRKWNDILKIYCVDHKALIFDYDNHCLNHFKVTL